MKPRSQQRRWQLQQQALGNCIICAKPRDGASAVLCERCRIRHRDRQRERKLACVGRR